jgi:hypothetical protein
MSNIQTTDVPRQLTLFDLEQLETRIRAGLRTFIDVGNALAEIKAADGHRLKGFTSFEAYCESEFGFGLRHGERLIQAAQVAVKVEAMTGELPRNEAVAREIARVAYSPKAETNLKAVSKELKREGKSLATATAEVVAKVVERVINPKPKVEQKPLIEEVVEEPPAWHPELVEGPATTLTDFCPSCGSIPESYVRQADGWHCSDCDAPVTIGVIATK